MAEWVDNPRRRKFNKPKNEVYCVIEAVKGFETNRRESQETLLRRLFSLAINIEATPELLGPKSRDAGISGLHESFRKPGSFQSQWGLV